MIKFFRSNERRKKKLQQIKYVASDLDGTLLHDDNSISKYTLDLVVKLQSMGIGIVILSGRTDAFIRSYSDVLRSKLPIVSLNGSLIKKNNGEILYGSFIKKELCELICEIAGRYPEMTLGAFTPSGILHETPTINLPKYLRSNPEEQKRVKTLAEYFDQTVLYVATGPYAAVQEIIRKTAKAFQDSITRVVYQTRSGTDLYYLELKNNYVTKGTALEFLAKYLNVKLKNFAAIGDFDNDIEMCRFAGVSAALRNAVDSLKDVVDFVTRKTNNEDGAAEFLQLIIDANLKK